MEGSKIAAVVAIIIVVVGVITALLIWLLPGVSFAPTAFGGTTSSSLVGRGQNCGWQPAFFNQVGDPVIIGSSCSFGGDNFNPFAKGHIIVGSVRYNDACVDGSFLNEYWCDLNTAKLSYGFCTAGCKVGPSSTSTFGDDPTGACASKVYVCGAPSGAI